MRDRATYRAARRNAVRADVKSGLLVTSARWPVAWNNMAAMAAFGPNVPVRIVPRRWSRPPGGAGEAFRRGFLV